MCIYIQTSSSSNKTCFIFSLSMSRVYPKTPSHSSPSYITSKPESFTIWMKSLVFNTRGCTVYNSKGEIVYRVDNYDNKCGQEVYLMDIRGKVLFSLLQKVLYIFHIFIQYILMYNN